MPPRAVSVTNILRARICKIYLRRKSNIIFAGFWRDSKDSNLISTRINRLFCGVYDQIDVLRGFYSLLMNLT